MDCGRLRLCDAFTVLYVHAVFVLVLTHSCRGQSEVIGPAHPVTALVGDDIILPRHLAPVMNAFETTVEWAREDLNPRFVLVWRDRVELESIKHPSFHRRTSLFTDQLKNGNISLRLSDVTLSDGGVYRCFAPELGKYSKVQLVVGPGPGPGPSPGPSSSAPIIVGLVVLVLVVLAVVSVVLWKWRQNKLKKKRDQEDEETQGVTESLIRSGTDGGTMKSRDMEDMVCPQAHHEEDTQQRQMDTVQTVNEAAEAQRPPGGRGGDTEREADINSPTGSDQNNDGGETETERQTERGPDREPLRQGQTEDIKLNTEEAQGQETQTENMETEGRMENMTGGEAETQPPAGGGGQGGGGQPGGRGGGDTEREADINSPTGSDQDKDGGETETERQTERGPDSEQEKAEEEDKECLQIPSKEDTPQRQMDSLQTVKETETQPPARGGGQPGQGRGDTEREADINSSPTGSDQDKDGGETETERQTERGPDREPPTVEEKTEVKTGEGAPQEDRHRDHERTDRGQEDKEKLQKKLQSKERQQREYGRRISQLAKNKQEQERKINEVKQQLEETERKLQSEHREEEEGERKRKEELQEKLKKEESGLERIKRDLDHVEEKKLKVEEEKQEIIRKLQPEDEEDEDDDL